ncbi:MAG: PilC/PilY family type IV pilus protein [Pseudomonadota bacterium]
MSFASLSLAAPTDLSDMPLANINAAITVKPNIMFILDDSGSTDWEFSPDFVQDEAHCKLAADGSGRSSATNRQSCLLGDPPFMSADFNKQYYNPAVRYAPPVDYDGSNRANQFKSNTAANTSGWTVVRTDGFNVQNKNQLDINATSINLTTQYPERVFCDAQSAATNDSDHCKTNANGYVYPSSTFAYGSVNGNTRYRYGAPYYFKLEAGEYCTADDLKVCIKVNPGDVPPAGSALSYPYPAKLRWCDSAAHADLSTALAGTCQGKKTALYRYVRFPTKAASAVTYASVKIGDSASDDAVSIAQLSVVDPTSGSETPLIINGNGVSSVGTASMAYLNAQWRLVVSAGTNSASERMNTATLLARVINNSWNWPARPYKACSKNTTPSCLSFALNLPNLDDTVVLYTTDQTGQPVNAENKLGFSLAVNAPSTYLSSASGTLTINNSGTGSSGLSLISSITVGPAGGPFVEVLNGGLSTFGSNKTAARSSAASAVSQRINAYLNTSPWEYSARVNTACGGQSAAANRVCIDAPLNNGSAPNNYVINVTAGGGVAVSTTTLSGGVSRYIPVSTSAFSGSVLTQLLFSRVNLSSAQTYPYYPGRGDCVMTAGVCTGDEEMTNFANWYSYYRSRMQAMKAGVSQAFTSLTSDYRLGFTTIHNTSFAATSSADYVPIQDLSNSQKQTWYNTLFSQNPSGGTPLRIALSAVGEMFSGKASYDPVQYSCQQNYSIMTTDGYWNDSANSLLLSIGNQDNVSASEANGGNYCTRSNGCFDGNLSGGTAAPSLADVALYYYARDLRPATSSQISGAPDNPWTANVPTSSKDPNPEQHMTTFTIGLGVDGQMNYRADYETAVCGGSLGANGESSCDFAKIKQAATNCEWTNGANGTNGNAVCNWPLPVADSDSTVDDLWHAAVNGHGKYFSVGAPDALAAGLKEVLNTMQVRTGSASASATSNAIVAPGDNDIFQATFTSGYWDGEVIAKKIDPASGEVLSAVSWLATNQLDNRVDDAQDSRTIYTLDVQSDQMALKPLRWSALTADEQAWLANKCRANSVLSQCASLSAAQKEHAENGENMLNYLRGQQLMETPYDALGNSVYRPRRHVLGDIANAKPMYLRAPRWYYQDSGYAEFKAANATRTAMLYVAANDGMLHAFKANSEEDAGAELWAYAPRQVLPNLWKLADNAYANHHQYFVDGSPELGDVQINGVWRTILVGGLNKGGRGFYALDVSNPEQPQALWEICADSALCPVADSDLGYTYGNPVITKRPSDGKWVVLVSSGYNNVNPGDGKGYLYVLDAANGQVLDKIGTAAGSTSTPSGLGKITAWAEDGQVDNRALRVYAGDYLGNLWRIDLASKNILKLAELTDRNGLAQAITAAPELGRCAGMHDMVFVGTGSYLGLSDLSSKQTQSLYAIKDSATPLAQVRNNKVLQRTLAPVTGSTVQGQGVTSISNAALTLDLTGQNGWFIDFDQHLGERVNMSPQLIRDTLLAFTNQPTNISACTTGGVSYKYQISACTGSYLPQGLAANNRIGEKFSDTIIVGFVVVKLPSNILKVIGTLANGVQTSSDVLTAGISSARRISWRELQ